MYNPQNKLITILILITATINIAKTQIVIDFSSFNPLNDDTFVRYDEVEIFQNQIIVKNNDGEKGELLRNVDKEQQQQQDREEEEDKMGLNYFKFSVESIPNSVRFLIIEVHSYLDKVKLEFNSTYSVYGSDTGLVILNSNLGKSNRESVYNFTISGFSYKGFLNSSKMLLVARAYPEEFPIPGGCNMEFPDLSITPFQLVNASDADILRVDLQPPSVDNALCEEKNNTSVELFHRYFYSDLMDGDSDEHFANVKHFLSGENMAAFGRRVNKYGPLSPYRTYYNTYRRTGVVLGALVKYGNISVPYISAVSYYCELEGDLNNCNQQQNPIAFYILFFLLLSFSIIKRLTFSMASVWVLFNIIFFLFYLKPTETFGQWQFAYLFVGLIGWPIFFVLSKETRKQFLVIPIFFLSAFVFDAAIFHFALYDLNVFLSTYVGWLTFAALFILTCIFLLSFDVPHGIYSTSFLAPYTILIPIDIYIAGPLHRIFLSVLRYANVPHFNEAVIDAPYLISDKLIIFFWFLLGILTVWRLRKAVRNMVIGRVYMNERTPLLVA